MVSYFKLPPILKVPSVISRDASARDATSSIFNDLQAAGSISNLVGRWGMKTGKQRQRLTNSELAYCSPLSTFVGAEQNGVDFGAILTVA